MRCKNCSHEMIEHRFTQTTIYECNECYSFDDVDTYCDHELEIIDFIVAGGSHQYWNVCRKCWRKIGSPLSQKNVFPIYKRPLDLFYKRVEELLAPEKEEIRNIKERLLLKKKELMAEYYLEYLKSTEWKEKRRLILVRDNHECQICKGKAVDVHHLTYAHFKKEYDFELISLCRSCHASEYHSEKADQIIEKVKTEKAILNSPDILT